MDQNEVSDALLGLYAYDSGAVDSGIRDELLRRRVTEYVQGLPMEERRLLVSRIARDAFLSEEALIQRYGLEDTQHFAEWLDENGMLI